MKLKYKNDKRVKKIKIINIILCVLLFLMTALFFVSISSAWFTDEKNLGGDVQMGSIDMNLFGNEKEKISEMPLTEILIANQQVFKYDIFLRKEATSRPMYARIYMEFTGDGSMELNDAVRRNLGSSADYKWEQIGPYFYLTDSSGAPINITGQAEYKFLNATKLKLPITVDSGLKLILNAKAIQSEGMGDNSPKNATELAEKMKDDAGNYYRLNINIKKPNEEVREYIAWTKGEYTIKNLYIQDCEVFINGINHKNINEYAIKNLTQNATINVEYKENVIELEKIKNYNVRIIENRLTESVSFIKGTEQEGKLGKFKIIVDGGNLHPNYLNTGYAKEFYYFEEENNSDNKYYLSGVKYGENPITEFWYDIPQKVVKVKPVYLIPNNKTGKKEGTIPLNSRNVVISHIVTDISKDSFKDSNIINSITIPSSVINIGYSSFRKCNSLLNIVIPDSIISIEGQAFYDCGALTNILIPNNVANIGLLAFYGCSNLTSINVSINNNKYASDNGVLYTKDKKELIQYPIGATNNKFEMLNGTIKIKESSFRGSVNLTEVIIPESVTDIEANAFYGCKMLSKVIIPSKVKKIIKYTFWGCVNLKNVELKENITNIEDGAFGGCNLLENFKITALKPPTLIKDAISMKVKNIYVPKNSLDAYKTAPVWKNYSVKIQAIQ